MSRPIGVRTLLTLATAGVAVLALVFAAVLASPLVRSSSERTARDALADQADLLARLPVTELVAARSSALSRAQRHGVEAGSLTADGEARGAAVALTADEKQRVLAGEPVSTAGRLAGQRVLVEARPLRNGAAVVLATPTATVDLSVTRLRRRLLLALALGLLVAVAAGAVAARTLSRPLAGLAGTARLLTEGRRGVSPPPTGRGPREVDEVAAGLHRLDEALAGSEERQRRFLLSVSHELRTPLTAVRGYAESLVDGMYAPDELPEVGATMVREAERMERYVADLLALGRLEADDFTLVDADLDVAEVLAEGARSWAQRFERAGLTLSVEAPDGLALRSDPGRIRQVLDVLTDNALRAGSPGDRVVWAAVASPGGVRLEVRDSGPGLTDTDAADAFEPGVLHDRYAGQRPGGQGLGLAIAHGLVTRMGGSIRLERAPEGGAAFVVVLPSRHSGH